MKVIFSRKGFDSTSGGIPSIKIGKNLQSLPIPYKKNTLTTYNNLNLGNEVKQLSKNKIIPTDTCHNDPNLLNFCKKNLSKEFKFINNQNYADCIFDCFAVVPKAPRAALVTATEAAGVRLISKRLPSL